MTARWLAHMPSSRDCVRGFWSDGAVASTRKVRCSMHMLTQLCMHRTDGNQEGVGAALARQSLRRDEYFVTSKIPGGLNASATTSALEQSLAQLKLPYVDLMLLHWPGSGAKSRQEQWVALESWAKQGKARAIGISHYCRHHLDDILKVATLPVALNQVQYHVGMVRRKPASGSRMNLPACACTTK